MQALADLGAEVIKVEPPHGCASRRRTSDDGVSFHWWAWGRSKRWPRSISMISMPSPPSIDCSPPPTSSSEAATSAERAAIAGFVPADARRPSSCARSRQHHSVRDDRPWPTLRRRI